MSAAACLGAGARLRQPLTALGHHWMAGGVVVLLHAGGGMEWEMAARAGRWSLLRCPGITSADWMWTKWPLLSCTGSGRRMVIA